MGDMKEQKGGLKNISKKSLRTMQKNRTRHIVREKARIVKYGTKGFWRNIWLSVAATIVMSVTLIILFVTIVASVILTNTAEMMKDKIDITIYFKPNTSKETLDELTEIIRKDSNVKSVSVSTSEEEYEKFLSENAESDSILNILDDEMKERTISKMQSTMRLKVHSIDNLDSIVDIEENNELFIKNMDPERKPTHEDVESRTQISNIADWARIARTGGMIFAGVFLVISVLIIFSTIRMAIFSRREEIYMMKLVGADKGFIRGPFLIEAEISGLIAGILSATVSYFGFMAVSPGLAEYGINITQIKDVLESNKLVLVFLAFIVVGVLIGRISARLAVSKYLKKT